jgi:subfamily B ATP-binding cassette protein MsbA
MESFVDGLFGKANLAVFRTSVRTARLRAINVPVAGLLTIIGLSVALIIGGNEIIAGRMGGASDLIAFMGAMVLMGTGVARSTKLNLLVQQAAAPCSRIWEIIDTQSTLIDAPDAIELPSIEGRITFRDVSFAYDADSPPVLTNLSVEVEPGQVVALAGPSGAGKTTVANLVPRLYDVTSGAVLVDGHDVRRVTRASLRRFMGIVPQDTVLFATTVRENIAYGRDDATLEQVIAAAQAAQAHEFISAMPNGYETDIGEGGVKLSGGQRQRIAIARALLRDPRVLILDEATSSLDAESESAVQAAISRLLQGRTALIIAHRLSTIRDADRILVMDRGRVVEEGTHTQLMAAGGLYRALYETQLREEATAGATEAHAT